ncbi:MAG: Flagellar biosynthesis chaperone [Pseudomonadota bacterium]|jgi:flagellar FliJ protein
MTTKNAINILTDLTTRQSEAAAKRLGQANKQQDQAKQQLDLLVDYRKSYAEQLQTQMTQGLTVSGYCNFYQFLANLDKAVDQQNKAWQTSLQFVENERVNWQLSERKRLSFNTLTQRAQNAMLREEITRDQKQTDEHATRKYSVKQ